MSYDEMLRRLGALKRFGMRPGLDGVRALLAAVGDPHARLQAVHVAGTNGKGSTAAFVESALRAGGVRTGLYTSPHLLRLTERIRIDGAEIGSDSVAGLAARVLAVGGEYTFFEVVTATAFLALAAAAVDVAVIEVGLGGRLDATNVLERPLVSVVTGVALDHTDVLGDTLAAIAREKAGIFKPGVPAVLAGSADDDDSVRDVLLGEAARLGATPVLLYGRDFDDRALPPLGLGGPHQRRNAALARQALALLPPALRPSPAALADGFARVRWPGRFEWLTPSVLVDAAHNADGARALAAALPDEPLTLILGVVADKDARGIVEALVPRAARVIVTAPPTPRALPAAALGALVPGAEVAPDLAAALALAGSARTVIAGSIFLIGEARRLVLGAAADATAVQDPVGQKL
jgi:dihydrofolate synthase / folylpolyglutamate synthase